MQYPLLLNGRNTMRDVYDISYYDHSMVIDREGIVQYSARGVDIPEIQGIINQLLTTDISEDLSVPFSFKLENNYPNPFNPQTTITFTVDRPQKISLIIYDAQGRLINTLIDSEYSAGRHRVTWNGKDRAGQSVASGAYFYRLSGIKNNKLKKMILLK